MYLPDSVAGEIIGLLGLGRKAAQARRRRHETRWEGRDERQAMRLLQKKLTLADKLGLPSAGIRRGGPPQLAETPYGEAVVRGGTVSAGKLFPMGSTSIVAAGAGVFAGSLEVRGERNFRPTRLVLLSSLANQVTVSDISVSTERQVSNLAVMPIEVFGPTVTAAWIDFSVVTPGVLVSIDLIFTATAASTAVVSGAFYGTEF